jgi:predicted bacteriocin transport accessory protein
LKKLIIDLTKYNGIAFAILFGVLIVTLVPLSIYSFITGNDFTMLPSLFTISGSNPDFSNSFKIQFGSNIVWQLLLIYICLTFIIFGIDYAKKKRNLLFVLVSLLAVGIQIFGFNYLSKNTADPLIETSVQQVTAIIEKKEDAIIYVGRENCPDCILYKPKLINFLQQKHIDIDYFNTTGNEKEMSNYRKYYNNLGVKSVPSIMFIKHGQIQQVLYGDKEPDKIEKEILKYKH